VAVFPELSKCVGRAGGEPGPCGIQAGPYWPARCNSASRSLPETDVPPGLSSLKPASQVNVVPAAAAQQLKAVLGNCVDFWKCAVPALEQSCCLLSGKVLYLGQEKEELVIHTSWTISTFSSHPDHPLHPSHTQKRSYRLAVGGARAILRKAHVSLNLTHHRLQQGAGHAELQ